MNIFRNITPLENGISAAWTRNKVFQNNIANVDTPNFKSSRVQFEELYQEALEENDGSSEKDLQDTLNNIQAVVVKDDATTYRMDGNNVDIDNEITGLAKNVIYYNTLTTKMTREFSQLKLAIREGK